MTTEQNVERPAGYDPSAFPAFAVTVDVVVLAVVDDDLHVALIRRAEEPFRGAWALPGGFKRPGETLDEAAERELREEADLRGVRVAQFGAYGDPGRDPRMNVVTVGYYATVAHAFPLSAGSDADDARWVSVAEVLDGGLRLAFDHARIVADARARLALDLDRSDAVLGLVGDEFTVSQLRRAYEAVWRLDLPRGPSVRRSRSTGATSAGSSRPPPGPFLVETGRMTASAASASASASSSSSSSSSSSPGRPAAFHRATDAWRETAPVRRPRSLR
jgi:8-oxo-dGTP diphosphatase